MSAAIASSELNSLWGTRLQAIRLDAHRPECRFELFWSEAGADRAACLVLASIQYSRLEFDEDVDSRVVEMVSIEAETCAVGIRVFGELSNGTFEFVCASFRVDPLESDDVA